ncbi:MAG TPA: hypothetical protein VMT70_20740 [Vicinamibacteria bacterium]|nr:hypothetical protein [Vicinamibacteria bacterium]
MRRLSFLVLALLAFGLGSPASAQAPQPPAPLPSPLPLLPPDNWWNQDVSAAPLDANSAGFLSLIGNPSVHPDFGGSDGSPFGVYGMVYAVVPGTTPLEAVDFSTYGYPDESDAGAPGRPPGYPIPPAARTEPKWVEGGDPATCDPNAPSSPCDGDRHLLLVDKDNRLLFELYRVHWNGSEWQAGSGGAWLLDSDARRPEGWTSADAAGLAILPGLVRYDEVFGADPIRHAFRVTVRYTNGHVWPASHTASTSSSADALPMGARLRLKSSVALGSLSAALQRIGQALKTYGLIVADNGSNMYVTGAYDPRWEVAPGSGVVGPSWPFHASDFEVVELGWRPVAPPDPTPRYFHTLSPCRLLDTRLAVDQPPPGTLGGPILGAGTERTITAAGRCGIPAGARAVAGNVTVANPTAAGDLRLYAGDSGAPNASTINFGPAKTRANNAIFRLSPSGTGTVAIRNDTPAAPVHVVIDVVGYFQ